MQHDAPTGARQHSHPVPKAEPKGKAASVSEAKSASASKAEPKETKQADPKVEVKKEKVGGDDAPGDSRGLGEGQKRKEISLGSRRDREGVDKAGGINEA